MLGAPGPIGELNALSTTWLAERVNGRAHSATKQALAARLEEERRFLVPLPRRRFDSTYVATRKVHVALPFIEWRGVRYSVPASCLGQKVAVREEVDAGGAEPDLGRGTGRPPPPGPGRFGSALGRGPPRRGVGHRPRAPAKACPPTPRTHAAPGIGLRRLRRGGPQPARALRGAMTGAYEQVKTNLDYLQLHRAAECFAPLAEAAAAQGQGHVEYLARVVSEQASATQGRRMAARLRYARFPYRRSIEEFDFSFQPSVDRKLVEDLASLRFIGEKRSVLFLGQPGLG